MSVAQKKKRQWIDKQFYCNYISLQELTERETEKKVIYLYSSEYVTQPERQKKNREWRITNRKESNRQKRKKMGINQFKLWQNTHFTCNEWHTPQFDNWFHFFLSTLVSFVKIQKEFPKTTHTLKILSLIRFASLFETSNQYPFYSSLDMETREEKCLFWIENWKKNTLECFELTFLFFFFSLQNNNNTIKCLFNFEQCRTNKQEKIVVFLLSFEIECGPLYFIWQGMLCSSSFYLSVPL